MADLFLSYHGPDRDAVRTVQRLLQARGLTTFLDRDSLPRGLPWPQALEDGLKTSRGVAVFLGRELGAWQKRELWYALDRQAAEEQWGRSFPVVPVLLPGADPGSGFLFLNTWVDLRNDALNAGEIDALVASLAGIGASAGPRGDSGICPYRGLYAFREEDAPFFHGRKEAIDRLVEKVTTSKLAAVVGSSGCGKSSVVMAGLVPRLRRERPPRTTWDVVSVTPGRAPLRRLARGLVGWLEPDLSPVDVASRSESLGEEFESGRRHPAAYVEEGLRVSGADRLLLVVDQFEELFTEAAVDARRPFARLLLDLIQRCPVVPALTLRADFYGHAIDLDRDLTSLIEAGGVPIGPLRREELRRAIVEPARLVGLAFEPPLLIEKLLDDVNDEPGNLPLLEYALTELWNGRADGRLREATYGRFEHVAGAIGARADGILKKFGNDDIVRRVMTRLVRTASSTTGVENTRRRVLVADLGTQAPAVVQAFSDPGVRLLVCSLDEAGRETVEVAHEALINAWRALTNWLSQDLEFRIWRQRLEPSLEYFLLDNSNILSGLALAEAEKWLDRRSLDLTPVEVELICVSLSARAAEAEETAFQRDREIQAARALAEESTARAKAEELARLQAQAMAETEAMARAAEANRRRRVGRMAKVSALVGGVAIALASVTAHSLFQVLQRERLRAGLVEALSNGQSNYLPLALLRAQHQYNWAEIRTPLDTDLVNSVDPDIIAVRPWVESTFRAETLLDVIESSYRLFFSSRRMIGAMVFAAEEVGMRSSPESTLRTRALSLSGRIHSDFIAYHAAKTPGFVAVPPDPVTDQLNRMVGIEGGKFVMSQKLATLWPSAEEEQSADVLAFSIQQHEVTNLEYRRFDPSVKFDTGEELHPVTSVSWYEAFEYAMWLGARLPSEAQWEYAAKWTTPLRGRTYPWGEETALGRAVHATQGGRRTFAVGSRPLGRTPQGLDDMAGNVSEWCHDVMVPYPSGGVYDPIGPSVSAAASTRVVRGGSFRDMESGLNALNRFRGTARSGRADLGFRLVSSRMPQ